VYPMMNWHSNFPSLRNGTKYECPSGPGSSSNCAANISDPSTVSGKHSNSFGLRLISVVTIRANLSAPTALPIAD